MANDCKRDQPARSCKNNERLKVTKSKQASKLKKLKSTYVPPDANYLKVSIPKKSYVGPKLQKKTLQNAPLSSTLPASDDTFALVKIKQEKEEMHDDCEEMIENESPPIDYSITRNRIIDIKYFMNNLMEIQQNHLQACQDGSLKRVSEEMHGLVSKITLACDFCNMTRTLFTHNPNNVNPSVNRKIVQGAIVNGPRIEFLHKMLNLLNIPPVQVKAYSEIDKDLKNFYGT